MRVLRSIRMIVTRSDSRLMSAVGVIAHSSRRALDPGATPAQIALAWLLAQGADIAPIPGTKRVVRVEENPAADGIELSAKQVERLSHLTPASGERHDEGNMAVIDR